jgi:nitrite reductase/ring-hydroxylating ferredoxin subunit
MPHWDASALRQRWTPALPEADLPGPGASPRAVGLFGEELIAFRQPDGRIGVIDGYCPHEGAPLHDGRIHQGARCSLHGWEFDATGARCDPYPGSRGDGVAAYQAAVSDGLVWVFMGSGEPGEPAPSTHETSSAWQLRAFRGSLDAVVAAISAIGGVPAVDTWPLAFRLPARSESPLECTLLLVPRDVERTSILCTPICRDEDMIDISRALR